jgi:hypothetical protein
LLVLPRVCPRRLLYRANAAVFPVLALFLAFTIAIVIAIVTTIAIVAIAIRFAVALWLGTGLGQQQWLKTIGNRIVLSKEIEKPITCRLQREWRTKGRPSHRKKVSQRTPQSEKSRDPACKPFGRAGGHSIAYPRWSIRRRGECGLLQHIEWDEAAKGMATKDDRTAPARIMREPSVVQSINPLDHTPLDVCAVTWLLVEEDVGNHLVRKLTHRGDGG